MTTKKFAKPVTSVTKKRPLPSPAQDQVMDVLRQLQQKVLASAALNGGFDTLMFKVEKIEEGQAQMGTKVDSIHEAIYHPDTGLFARVKDVEHVKEKIVAVEKLEKDLTHIQHQREHEQTNAREASQLSKDNEKAVKQLEQQVKDLSSFKTRVCTAAKWLAVTVGGGILTGLGKLLYDFASGHITIH